MTDTPRSGIKSRPKDAERPTRKPMRAWDRIKVFLFLLACFFALVWASMAGDQLANVSTSFRDARSAKASRATGGSWRWPRSR